ncbi:GNAT family N-acetyltransferase [Jannaschia aquimarina]|uniref:N-acetyltransferase domain-containing protein n=1 Tax=Jannaschia aquimarina TaxID=935700 RepID=A0A0D1EH46_9RHOB|nr:GNAT family protein [Jannaschia aquimarina]KIT16206.1 hypothetical protein jaqu_20670 [Jannaschia aquimarina]SNT39849.1 Protein N-acetyltransferase, RimJ/RimL family [Jannaschia aquimarina]
MPEISTLTGPGPVRRAPRGEGADTLVAVGRDPEISKWSGVHSDTVPPLEMDWATSWLRQIQQGYAWVIARDGALIGTISLHDVWLNEGRAGMAIGLQSPPDMGWGCEALGLLLEHAFETLALHRIAIQVMATTARAIRCYEACGLVDGHEREAALTAKGRVDDLNMDLPATEWRAAA